MGAWRSRRMTRGFLEAREELAAWRKGYEEAGRDPAVEAEGYVG